MPRANATMLSRIQAIARTPQQVGHLPYGERQPARGEATGAADILPCRTSFRRMYPLAGALLSLASPTGYLLVRSAILDFPLTSEMVRAEIYSQPLVYAYLLFSTLAALVSLGWAVGRKEDTLVAVSATDPLTGLWNRRHLAARIAEEVGRAARYGGPVSMLLVDLDGLKQINDQRGHAAGDDAIRRVAACLRDTCRATDIVARYGGDEFIVLAPGASAAHAVDLAGRILEAVRAASAPFPISVSIGVADLASLGRGAALNPDALHESADQALYKAKASGRDRAVLSAPVPHPAARAAKRISLAAGSL